MASTPLRTAALSPFDSPTGRQSPFRRQNSVSPATTVRAGTPTTSPTKVSSALSPNKNSPFVRRPSQVNNPSQTSSERPSSPFARPTSGLGLPDSPTRRPREDKSIEEEAPGDVFTSLPLSPARNRYQEIETPSSAGFRALSQANLRPAFQRPLPQTASPTLRSPQMQQQSRFNAASQPSANGLPPATTNGIGGSLGGGGGAPYSHIPQPLLHSMRESFEVLDSRNTGTVGSAQVAEMLTQLGLDAGAGPVAAFFPANSAAAPINLARYLDRLATPLAALSPPEELRAAFEAFDVDDSGQVDVATLRAALRDSAGGALSAGEIDGILGEFTARRAFGARGINAAAATRAGGEVFRYRDFMANLSGGGMGAGAGSGGQDGQGLVA